jgi:hypothetical protein
MRGAIPPLSQYVFMAWCLVKHRDNFTFTFLCEQTTRKQNKKTNNFNYSGKIIADFLRGMNGFLAVFIINIHMYCAIHLSTGQYMY